MNIAIHRFYEYSTFSNLSDHSNGFYNVLHPFAQCMTEHYCIIQCQFGSQTILSGGAGDRPGSGLGPRQPLYLLIRLSQGDSPRYVFVRPVTD